MRKDAQHDFHYFLKWQNQFTGQKVVKHLHMSSRHFSFLSLLSRSFFY